MANKRKEGKAVKVKTLEQILQVINKRYVRIKKQEKKNNNIVLYTVLEELLKIMRKCDNLFDSMKPKVEYLGSYFDGLRVGQPTEYDLNVILTVHVNYNKIMLESQKHAYTSIKMPEEFRRLSKMPVTAMKGFDKTEFWCNSDHRLSVPNFRAWMQGVVDAALYQLPEEDGKRILKVKDKIFKLNFKMSGPANTITIHLDDSYVIDVDLVPTLRFELPKIPLRTQIDFEKVKKTNVPYYFAVPKPSDDDFSWRLAFPYQERYYTDNKNNLKSTLKLLKLFRDVQEFDKLASYFIKTLFLWEIVETDEKFWKKKSLTFLLLHMLGKLRDNLAVATIKNFWCPDHNLLEKIKPETCKNWSNRISNIISDIERNQFRDPSTVNKYFSKQTNN
ncbi:cyclic GMP-AMP synthase-like receptor isoform X1 [Anticarsia gemmatalis]|uniref:cyclic GMP-AMP synthase-like receptor isoform X1 n=1 Tax=Anticarsia gemmatalis TaxID=129554 RepID=UPI003F75DEF2